MIQAKIDLLSTWLMIAVGTADVPLGVKWVSYLIAISVGITALIRFYWDWDKRRKEKEKEKK
jgi:hypothetical protein